MKYINRIIDAFYDRIYSYKKRRILESICLKKNSLSNEYEKFLVDNWESYELSIFCLFFLIWKIIR